ncbi:hypothetical protein MNEG_15226, partial [Monoraphidium neglectum]
AAHLQGGYTQFCGYFRVDPATMRIGTQRAPDRVRPGLQRWRDAGLAVSAVPMPYDPSDDADGPAAQAARMEAMQRLQRGEAPAPRRQQ